MSKTIKGEQMSKTIKGIDWKLLRKQKLHLLEILDYDESSVTAEQHQSIEGIVAMIDGIQDEAAKELSEEVVFGLIPCTFTSEWDDGSIVTTDCTYNEQTGEVEPEVSKGHIPTGMVTREFITIKGEELTVCPECHGYVMKTVMEDLADQSYGEIEVCSDPNCIDISTCGAFLFPS